MAMAWPLSKSPARHLIVVVEDELLIRMAICASLAEAGFGVVDTHELDWALTYIRDHARDISALFTDIHVGGSMDGLALAHPSRRTWPWISLLVASARAQPKPHELPAECRFIPKPYEPDHVIGHLTALVGA